LLEALTVVDHTEGAHLELTFLKGDVITILERFPNHTLRVSNSFFLLFSFSLFFFFTTI